MDFQTSFGHYILSSFSLNVLFVCLTLLYIKYLNNLTIKNDNWNSTNLKLRRTNSPTTLS